MDSNGLLNIAQQNLDTDTILNHMTRWLDTDTLTDCLKDLLTDNGIDYDDR